MCQICWLTPVLERVQATQSIEEKNDSLRTSQIQHCRKKNLCLFQEIYVATGQKGLIIFHCYNWIEGFEC